MGTFWGYFLDFFGLAWTTNRVRPTAGLSLSPQETRTL